MSKIFNVTAVCIPEQHYMVNIDSRLAEIKKLIDDGKYFTINKARQYGKTTTLMALEQYLKKEYYVVSMDFQTFGNAKFENENIFSATFARSFLRLLKKNSIPENEKLSQVISHIEKDIEKKGFELTELFENLSDVCGACDKRIVLLIDEVDSATNNQVFLDFLAQLRAYYIRRGMEPTFKAVVLAGVYDIKNLKRKLRPEDEHRANSPWNIASDFHVDMNFHKDEIAEMLEEYEADYHTGMNVDEMAARIFDYTSGYPFLVSRLCKLLDEEIAGSENYPTRKSAWTREGFLDAVKILLAEKNTLFESMVNKLHDYPELRKMIFDILFSGKEIAYNSLDRITEIATMFGFVKNSDGKVAVANRIFETVFYDLFLTSADMQNTSVYQAAVQDKNQFIAGGHLNMRLVLEKFTVHFDDLYGDQDTKFYEEDGRRFFLLYLRPIINGTGNYYIESRTRNMERTDVIVDYRGEQFVVELKVWRGNAYHTRGEKQLTDYLDYYHLDQGYMLSFNFNKKKEVGVQEIHLGEKILIEAVV